MISNAEIPHDRIAASVVTRSVNGARWCGTPIEAGDLLIHGPETAHTATNPAGTAFTFATVPIDDVRAASESMGSEDVGLTGTFLKLPRTPAAQRLGDALGGALGNGPGLRLLTQPPLESMALIVADAIDVIGGDLNRSRARQINDASVVNACVQLAESMGRVPSIGELRHVAHVSETRLRVAFARQLGMSPSAYLRKWGLDRARRRLTAPSRGSVTVASIATDLGFAHLGRFARYYRDQFGELPSTTLAHAAGP